MAAAGAVAQPSLARQAAARLGVELAFDEQALDGFFAAMADLFLSHQNRVDPAYQLLLYTVEHPHGREDLDRIDDAFGVPHPQWSGASAAEAVALLDRMRYPDTMALASLRGVPGLTLSHVARYLHFFHHVYPIYDRAACAGLGRLGVEVPFLKDRDPTVYGLFIAAVEALKEQAPYWGFPECNVSLQRVVQGALSEYGA